MSMPEQPIKLMRLRNTGSEKSCQSDVIPVPGWTGTVAQDDGGKIVIHQELAEYQANLHIVTLFYLQPNVYIVLLL
jgi:hypothetical protein